MFVKSWSEPKESLPLWSVRLRQGGGRVCGAVGRRVTRRCFPGARAAWQVALRAATGQERGLLMLAGLCVGFDEAVI